jgi:hypothetical protein
MREEKVRDIDKVKDLPPEAVKLGFDFVTAVKKRDSSAAPEILEQIEKFPTIWHKSITDKIIICCFLGNLWSNAPRVLGQSNPRI